MSPATRILREAGRVFLRVVRSEDEIFRVGGDEFALVRRRPSRAWPPSVADRLGSPSASSGADIGCRRSPRESRRFPTMPARPSTCSGRPTSRSTPRSWPARTGWDASTASGRRPRRRPRFGSCRPARGQRGLRLLVVDDDPALRILLRTTFEVVDIEVEEAEHRAELASRADRRAKSGRGRARRRTCRARTA